MAIPSSSPFRQTGDPILDVTENGYVWYFKGSDHIINWSTSGSDNWNFGWFDSAKLENFSAMFDAIATVCDLSFNYLGYFSTGSSGPGYVNAYHSGSDINISFGGLDDFFKGTGYTAFCYFPTTRYNYYSGAPGDMWLNSDNPFIWSKANYNPGYEGFYLILHEALHGLGLKHPHDDGGTGRPTYAELGLKYFDRQWFSVMSYDELENGGDEAYTGSMPVTPMLFDVVALQHLYGENQNHANDDTYNMLYHLGYWYETIWDSGGYDILDFRSYTRDGVSVSLGGFNSLELPHQAGYFTTYTDELAMAKAEQRGLAIPNPGQFGWLYGEFEDVYGTVFDDQITGNTLDNLLAGLKGDDLLDGDTGIDYAAYLGKRTDFSARMMSSDSWLVTDKTGSEGVDELYNIERLIFQDKNVALDIEGNAGQAYRIYQAAFDRTPDTGGLGFWISQIDLGMSLTEVAARFIDSAEFRNLYGTAPSTEDFISRLYYNVLHRAPEQEGYTWWVSTVKSGAMTRDRALAGFSESEENQLQVIGSISDGIDYILWQG